MMNHIFGPLGPAQEDAYFRNKEAELLARRRRQAELEAEVRRIGESIGAVDQRVFQTLQELGYTRDTVALLPLVPVVQIAWANGEVSSREAKRIRELALLRGLGEGTPAFKLLESWLLRRPSDEFFLKTLRVIRCLLSARQPEDLSAAKQDLISCCTYIAQGSGAFLGLGDAIGVPERKALGEIATGIEAEKEAATGQSVQRQL